MIELKIYDTAAKNKVDFKPLVDGKVSIYVCGLTVYDLPHIGHARTFVVFDVFRRFLKQIGYEVKFVRNHTDIDDKIKEKAHGLKDKVDGALDKTDIDDKLKEKAAGLKEKVDGALAKTDIDDKIKEKAHELKDKIDHA